MNAILPVSFRDFAEAKGLGISSEIVVDSFAGGGGASLGIEQALKRLHAMGMLGVGDPDGVNVAINHDAAAIAMHQANHPNTLHLPHDIWRVDPLSVTSGFPVGLLWASPDCRHHSKAKGGRPVSASVRDLAWVVAHWAEQVRPRMIFLENVEEFRQWGPLIPDGKGGLKPCPTRRGRTFKRWIGKFRKLGYSRIEYRELRSCDYGDPTIRKRLYIIMRCDDEPIVWPTPTHGDPKSDEVKSGKLLPWPVAADIIEWDRPCPSIFMSKEEARGYTKATGTRIIRPLAFNTEARIAKGVKRHVIDKAEPFIVTCNHGGDWFRGQGIREPFNTVTAARDARGLVDAQLAPYLVPRYGERAGQEPRSRPIDKAAPTIVPTGNGGNLAAVFLAQHNTMPGGGVHPGRPVDEPLSTVTTRGTQKAQIAAYLAQHNTDMVGHDAEEPLSTIVGKGSTQGVVSAHMLSLKGSDRRASGIDEPHRAVTAQGQHSGVVMPLMTAYYGTDEVGGASDEPVRTVTGKPRFGHVEAHGDVPPLTPEQIAGAKRVAEFLRRHGCWDGGDIVTVGAYVIVDIGMRMLTPRELARAQGFPDDYVLAAPHQSGVLTETEQRHKIGNSVCPGVAEALVFANFRPMKRTAPPPDEQGWLFAEAA